MAKTDEQENYISEYAYGANHLLVGLKVDGAWYNYRCNYRGDIVAITDETGNLATEYTYDSWGKPITKNVIDDKLHDQPIHYASYYYDEDLKLYYLTARYYHPEHAVFLSVDPLVESDESIEVANGYAYVMNNPITNIDPTGETSFKRIQYAVTYAIHYYLNTYFRGLDSMPALIGSISTKMLAAVKVRGFYKMSLAQQGYVIGGQLKTPQMQAAIKIVKRNAKRADLKQSLKIAPPIASVADVATLVLGFYYGYKDYRSGKKFNRKRVKNY